MLWMIGPPKYVRWAPAGAAKGVAALVVELPVRPKGTMWTTRFEVIACSGWAVSVCCPIVLFADKWLESVKGLWAANGIRLRQSTSAKVAQKRMRREVDVSRARHV